MGINNPSGGGGVWTLLHDETLAAPGRFDVSGLSQTHNALWVYLLIRSSEATTIDSIRVFFNGDTTITNYQLGRILADTDGVTWATVAEPGGGRIPGATATANYFATTHILIPFYTSTTFNKNMHCVTNARELAADLEVQTFNIQWENTAAVNQITIQPNGFAADNFVTDSQLLIYGIT